MVFTLMKSTPIVLGGFLAALLVAGCQTDESADSTHPYGKPVVVLVSVSESAHTTRDLTPTTPYAIPDYPAALLQEGQEGFVDARLAIQPDGSVKDAAILKSTDRNFENSVLLAVKTWQFPQLRRPPADADRDVEIVCRLRFSIQQYWYDEIGSGLPGSPDHKGGTMSAPSRSSTVTPR